MSGSVGLLWQGSPIVVGKVPCGFMRDCEDRIFDCPPSFRFCVVCCGPGESQVTVAKVGTAKELRPPGKPSERGLALGCRPGGVKNVFKVMRER